jgi:hypothetical protein
MPAASDDHPHPITLVHPNTRHPTIDTLLWYAPDARVQDIFLGRFER